MESDHSSVYQVTSSNDKQKAPSLTASPPPLPPTTHTHILSLFQRGAGPKPRRGSMNLFFKILLSHPAYLFLSLIIRRGKEIQLEEGANHQQEAVLMSGKMEVSRQQPSTLEEMPEVTGAPGSPKGCPQRTSGEASGPKVPIGQAERGSALKQQWY